MSSRKIIYPLTGIKMFLCAAVVLSNMILYPDVDPGFVREIDWGYFRGVLTASFRVDVFFMITGFLLYYLYNEEFKDGFSARRYGRFIFVRLARIYPLYVFSLFLILGLYGAGIWQTMPFQSIERIEKPLYALFNFTLTTAWGLSDGKSAWNGPAWSISAEFFNYLAFPLYLYVLVRLKSPLVQLAALCGLFAVYGGAQMLVFRDYTIDHGAGALMRANFGLLAGAVIYRLYTWPAMRRYNWDWIFIGLIFALFAMMTINQEIAPVNHIFFILPMPFILLAAALSGSFVKKFLSLPVPVYLGKLAFAMYLLHQPVTRIMQYFFFDYYQTLDFTANPGEIWLNLLAVFAVLLAAAAAAYHFIERPARFMLRGRASIQPPLAP